MKIRDQLRAIGVINTFDILTRFGNRMTGIACQYHAQQPRSVLGSRTLVWSPFFKTAPNSAAWYDHGNKALVGDRAESLPAAVAWATTVFRIMEWAPCPTDPGNTRIPKCVRDAAIAAAREEQR